MHRTFEYCSARFLDLWLRKEAGLFEAMQRPDGDAVRATLAHFKVSRGFARIADPSVATSVVSLLVEHGKYITPKTAPLRVSALASSPEFGNESHQNISAASKLLWMRHRAPFVIYDSQALAALQKWGPLKAGDYAAYYETWNKAYTDTAPEIKKALAKLSTFAQFTALAEKPTELEDLVREEWFAQRVFDQYLWIVGKG